MSLNAVLSWLDPLTDGQSVGVKANISVKGLSCHGGIKAYKEDIATDDATVVSRLQDAGYNITAILNMEEGALGAQTDNPWFGKTFNPLKEGYSAGGSSGGSAAAVAAGEVDVALGTDSMGSVRIPSAYCGIWGFKPSHDVAMLDGVMPLSPTLDTVGVHGRTLSDLAAVGEIICARRFGGGQPSTIAVLDYSGSLDVSPDVDDIFQRFVRTIGAMGSGELSGYQFGKSRRAGLLVCEVEGYEVHGDRIASDPEGFSPFFREMLAYGHSQPLEKVEAAYDHIRGLRREAGDDFILMPTAPQVAFPFGTPVPPNQADFSAYANLADRPAISFPIGYNRDGLPVSAQLVGPRNREADLFATLFDLSVYIPESLAV